MENGWLDIILDSIPIRKFRSSNAGVVLRLLILEFVVAIQNAQ